MGLDAYVRFVDPEYQWEVLLFDPITTQHMIIRYTAKGRFLHNVVAKGPEILSKRKYTPKDAGLPPYAEVFLCDATSTLKLIESLRLDPSSGRIKYCGSDSVSNP